VNRPATIAPLVDQAPEPLREYIARLERAAGDDFRVDRVGGVHSGDPESSHYAAKVNFPRSGSQREAVLLKLVEFGADGATFEQLQVATRIESAAKRLTELVQGGWAIQTKATRKTHTGAKATVHIASVKALRELERERRASQTAGGDGFAPSRDAEPVRDCEPPTAQVAAPSAVEDQATPLFADGHSVKQSATSAYNAFEDAA